jgi:hypothetical protein
VVAFELAYGRILDGFFVCHSRDTPPCVNPLHLFLGTCFDNNRDAAQKGRTARAERNGAYTKPERRRYGEEHGMSQLTAAEVRRIRHLRGEMTQRDVAKMYDIGQAHVSAIQLGQAWRHVLMEEAS